MTRAYTLRTYQPKRCYWCFVGFFCSSLQVKVKTAPQIQEIVSVILQYRDVSSCQKIPNELRYFHKIRRNSPWRKMRAHSIASTGLCLTKIKKLCMIQISFDVIFQWCQTKQFNGFNFFPPNAFLHLFQHRMDICTALSSEYIVTEAFSLLPSSNQITEPNLPNP